MPSSDRQIDGETRFNRKCLRQSTENDTDNRKWIRDAHPTREGMCDLTSHTSYFLCFSFLPFPPEKNITVKPSIFKISGVILSPLVRDQRKNLRGVRRFLMGAFQDGDISASRQRFSVFALDFLLTARNFRLSSSDVMFPPDDVSCR